MKLYDVCLHIGAGGDDWLGSFYKEIKKELERRGLSVIFFTSREAVKDSFVNNGVDEIVFAETYKGKVDVNWALGFVSNLGFTSPQRLYISEKKFYDIPEDECAEYFSRLVYGVSKLTDSPKAKFYITYEGDEFDHNIFRIYSRMQGGKSLYWGISNLNVRIHFHDNEKRYFETPLYDVNHIAAEEIAWMKDFIEGYTEKKTNLWGDPKRDDIKFKLYYLLSAAKKVCKTVFGRELDPRIKFKHSFVRYFKRIIRRQYAYTQYTKNFSFDNKYDYYYFPLHIPFDSQLTQRGLPFYNQVSLIQTISNYLPYGSKLIVKEHPMGRGCYSTSDIKALGSLPNVILLPAYANSHNIVPNVKGIFVINSSVGYEAFMYKKSVVTFGRSFYRKQGLTIDIDSLYDLEEVFERLNNHQVTEEAVYEFLFRVKESTYPVDLYNINETNFNEKIEVFSDAIEKELHKRMHDS